MAQFRGTVQGNRSQSSRLGHKTSGLTTECNGWNIGVKCYAYHDKDTGKDVIRVYRTSGSGYRGDNEVLATITEE